MQENKVFSFGDKMVNLTFNNFEGNVDIDDVLKIDYANIVGELLTFPVIVNRFGVLLAEMEEAVKKAQFNLELSKADFEEEKAKIEQEVFKELKKTISSPTLSQINGTLIQREDYKNCLRIYNNEKLKQIELETDKAKINSLYWAAKAKMDIITKMTDKIIPSDFEGNIIDGSINGILIKVRDKLIK